MTLIMVTGNKKVVAILTSAHIVLMLSFQVWTPPPARGVNSMKPSAWFIIPCKTPSIINFAAIFRHIKAKQNLRHYIQIFMVLVT